MILEQGSKIKQLTKLNKSVEDLSVRITKTEKELIKEEEEFKEIPED